MNLITNGGVAPDVTMKSVGASVVYNRVFLFYLVLFASVAGFQSYITYTDAYSQDQWTVAGALTHRRCYVYIAIAVVTNILALMKDAKVGLPEAVIGESTKIVETNTREITKTPDAATADADTVPPKIV